VIFHWKELVLEMTKSKGVFKRCVNKGSKYYQTHPLE